MAGGQHTEQGIGVLCLWGAQPLSHPSVTAPPLFPLERVFFFEMKEMRETKISIRAIRDIKILLMSSNLISAPRHVWQ